MRILQATEVDLLERNIPDDRAVTLDSGNLTLQIGHDEIVTLRLKYEEKAVSQASPVFQPDSHAGCGCSSMNPLTPTRNKVVYMIAFWFVVLLIPGVTRRWLRV